MQCNRHLHDDAIFITRSTIRVTSPLTLLTFGDKTPAHRLGHPASSYKSYGHAITDWKPLIFCSGHNELLYIGKKYADAMRNQQRFFPRKFGFRLKMKVRLWSKGGVVKKNSNKSCLTEMFNNKLILCLITLNAIKGSFYFHESKYFICIEYKSIFVHEDNNVILLH